MSFLCLDCKVDTYTEYYVVNRRVWVKANPNIVGMLCIGCIENRIGRILTKEDFSQAPVNYQYFDRKSARLKNRLGI